MGKVIIITPEQKCLLDKFRKDSFLSSNFYFTGGTALSLYYLQHRESVDLDFFSEKPFALEDVVTKIDSWKKSLKLSAVDYVTVVNTHIFNLTFPHKLTVKVDFNFYPYKRLDKQNVIDGIMVDSKTDIAVNKLLTIQQRTAVKDFVDLYFLLQDFTIWDLIEGVRIKFKVKMDLFVIGSDFLKVENFDYLPKMVKPLTLEKLKEFFRKEAEKLGRNYLE